VKGELVAVGTEMLLFGRRDGNGDWMAPRLASRGCPLVRRTIVADEAPAIAAALKEARERADLVVVTGGLGPTVDDVTREGLALAIGRPLRIDEALRESIRRRLRARGYLSEIPAERQSLVPEGCGIVENPVGSAPGLQFAGGGGGAIIVLPGVPAEMKAMFDPALERIPGLLPSDSARSRSLLVAGLPESEVDARLEGVIGVFPHRIVTILAAEGGVELHVLGMAEEAGAAAAEADRTASEIRARLGGAVVGEGGTTLAEAVGRSLERRRQTVSVAESCTGGLLGGALTSVPGSSAWFAGGFIVYANAMKETLLGVDPGLIGAHGAVSEEVARAMADGARARTGTSYALAVTGIAGPDGGGPDKPVGLVHLGLATPSGTSARRHHFTGDRRTIRARTVAAALEWLRRTLAAEG
jgi:nicotinamide-nucleotide amidase